MYASLFLPSSSFLSPIKGHPVSDLRKITGGLNQRAEILAWRLQRGLLVRSNVCDRVMDGWRRAEGEVKPPLSLWPCLRSFSPSFHQAGRFGAPCAWPNSCSLVPPAPRCLQAAAAGSAKGQHQPLVPFFCRGAAIWAGFEALTPLPSLAHGSGLKPPPSPSHRRHICCRSLVCFAVSWQ